MSPFCQCSVLGFFLPTQQFPAVWEQRSEHGSIDVACVVGEGGSHYLSVSAAMRALCDLQGQSPFLGIFGAPNRAGVNLV